MGARPEALDEWDTRRLLSNEAEPIPHDRNLDRRGPNEQHIDPSVDAIVAAGVSLLAPGHCTGWHAAAELAKRHIGAIQPLAVGMRLRLEGTQR